jgi:hypothetical protein
MNELLPVPTDQPQESIHPVVDQVLTGEQADFLKYLEGMTVMSGCPDHEWIEEELQRLRAANWPTQKRIFLRILQHCDGMFSRIRQSHAWQAFENVIRES